MENIRQYTVITDTNLTTFVDKINEAIAQGWQPAGGISCAVETFQKEDGERDGSVAHFSQALVR